MEAAAVTVSPKTVEKAKNNTPRWQQTAHILGGIALPWIGSFACIIASHKTEDLRHHKAIFGTAAGALALIGILNLLWIRLHQP